MSAINLQQMFAAYQDEDELTVLPSDTYELEVIQCSAKEDRVTPVYKVRSGPYAGKRVMAGQLVFSEKARSITFRKLSGFGIGQDFIMSIANSPNPMQELANALVGRVIRVKVEAAPWQGEMRNNLPINGIQLVSGGGGVAGAAAPPPAAPTPQAAPTPAPAAPAPPPQAAPAPPAAPASPPTPAPAPAPAAPPLPPVPPAGFPTPPGATPGQPF